MKTQPTEEMVKNTPYGAVSCVVIILIYFSTLGRLEISYK